METPALLQALDLNGLVGKPVDEARTLIEAAGGAARIVGPDDAVTQEYRSNRVTLVAEDGKITAVGGIG
jgi:hypothetical protein